MQGNIQIEVLNESAAYVVLHLRDVSDFDKQVIVMSLANALDLTPNDILLTSLMYPDFIDKTKRAKTDLSNNRSTPDL